MIKLSNGREINYMIASGALAFDGMGWLWERPLVQFGLIKPELFTVVIKTLTRQPREGYLRWWKPWDCVRLIPGGSVNKVGLTNPGIDYWCEKIAPTIDFRKYSIAGSISGTPEDLVVQAGKMNKYDLVALKANPSCPNAGPMPSTETVIEGTTRVVETSRHPVIVKVSVAQDYLAIARGLKGIAEAISLNSVPWEMAFPGQRSPLWRLQERVGGGGGGVSGKPAQYLNWKAIQELALDGSLPVIGCSVMEYDDLNRVRKLGAEAISFGAIHLADYPILLKPHTVLTNPLKPTRFVQRDIKLRSKHWMD